MIYFAAYSVIFIVGLYLLWKIDPDPNDENSSTIPPKK